MRPRISAGERRRIALLARRAHAFHRFAHHPLCAAYTHEVFVIRGIWLCRGCTLSWIGAALGLAIGLAFPPSGAVTLSIMAAACVASAGIALSRVRLGKIGKRLVPFAVVGVSIGAGLRVGTAFGAGIAAAVAATVVVGLLLYRRRGPWRAPCGECAEAGSGVCSGFRRQFRRERAVQRLVGRWLQEPSAVAVSDTERP